MHLTGLDLLFWAAGFIEKLRPALRSLVSTPSSAFPFFTALITLIVIRTIALYFVNLYGTKNDYAYAYWTLAILDMTLQLCVVYEVASLVFRPLNVWAEDIRSSFVVADKPEFAGSAWPHLAGQRAVARLGAGFDD